MRSVLEKQCSAVWRLTDAGVWETVHVAPAAEIGPLAQIAELFASICLAQLRVGATVTARFAEDMIIAAVDEEGVLVALRERGGNPIMIKTAMSRLETRSRRGEGSTMSARREQPAASVTVEPVAAEAVPTTDFDRPPSRPRSPAPPPEVRSRTPRVEHDDLVSFEEPSSGDWSEPESSPNAPSEPAAFSSAPAAPPVEDSLAEPSLSFDIVFTDQEEEVSSVAVIASDEFRAGCTWDDVADYFAEVLAASMELLGRSVTANYWRQAIDGLSALDGRIKLDPLGRVSIGRPGEEVTPREAEALSRAVEQWKSRAERALGDVEDAIPGLSLMPWRAVNYREEVQ